MLLPRATLTLNSRNVTEDKAMSTNNGNMMPKRGNTRPWITPDFAVRFREALGRDMTRQEREFFGLDESTTQEEAVENDIPDPAWFV